jgi:hypothetical protein
MWRHKILDALRKSDKTELKGVVEADETFFNISYKGSKPIERPSRKRGGEVSVRGLSKEKVCIPCAIDRETKLSISRIGGIGKTSRKTVENVFSYKIKEKSVLCTDREKSYIKFAKSYGLEHIRLQETKAKRGIYHIQHINSFHSRLKDFIEQFRGISTKHLNNYLVYNSVIHENSSRNSERFTLDKVLGRALMNVGRTLYRNVSTRPAVPV